jgi:hypothetical protein
MSTQKERAWQALKLAKCRLSDAALVIADNLVFERRQPSEDEQEEFRNATKVLERAHREYAKTIKKQADK